MNTELHQIVQEIDRLSKDYSKLEPLHEYFPPNPPATEQQIQQLIAAVPYQLPDDYLDLLRICNGWRHLFAYIDLLSIEEIIKGDWKQQVDGWIEIQEEEGGLDVDFYRVLPIGVGWDQADGTDLILYQFYEDGSNEVVWWHFYPIGDPNPTITAFLKEVYEGYLQDIREAMQKNGLTDDV